MRFRLFRRTPAFVLVAMIAVACNSAASPDDSDATTGGAAGVAGGAAGAAGEPFGKVGSFAPAADSGSLE